MKNTFKRTMIIALCACLSAVVFVSCTDFFTNSWAVNAKRDFSLMKIDASNVFDVLKAARGDSEMSLEILGKIAGQIDGASASDKDKLREAALTAAAQGTDLTGLFISSIDKLTAALNNGDRIEDMVDAVFGSADLASMKKASADLVKILPAVGADGIFTEDFHATDEELIQAAFVIILAETNADPIGYLSTWNNSGGKQLTTIANLTPGEQALAGIVNKLGTSSDLNRQITGMLS
jgi:hypothetical protein